MHHKKVKQLAGTIILVGSLLLTGCGGSASSQSSSSESTDSTAAESTENAEANTEQAAESAETEADQEAESTEAETGKDAESAAAENAVSAKASESVQVDCSFELDGKSYTLPCSFSELTDNGWTTDSDTDTELGGLTYTWIYMYKEGLERESLTFDIFNGSGNTKKLSECQVASIEVDSSDLESISFSLNNGITVNDDMETVIGIMGTPTDTSESDNYTSIKYGKGRETGEINFVWFKGDNPSSRITVAHFPRQETETSSEVPEYLSEYQAPSAMGEDFDSGTFSLDGVLYRLPCPMSEFVKDGWTIKRDEEVMANRTGYIYMEKNGIEMSAGVMNYADYQTYASNCAVCKIEFNVYSDKDPVPDLILPKGLTFDTDLNTLDSITASSSLELPKSESDVFYSYYCDDYDKNVHMTIYYKKEDKRITSINFGRDQWP